MARSTFFDICLLALAAAADAVTLKPFAAVLRGEILFFTMPPHSAVGLLLEGKDKR